MKLTYIQSFLLDLINNYIEFFLLELFTTAFFSYKYQKQYSFLRTIYLLIYFVIALIPSIPYHFLLFRSLEFIYILFVSAFHWKHSLLFFIKYVLFYNFLYFACSLISTIININNSTKFITTDIYIYYQTIINTTFVFILLNLFLYHKRLKNINKHSTLSLNFSLFAISSIILLLFYNRFLLENQELNATFSYLFLFVIGVTIFNTHNYRKLIEMMDEQIQQRVLIEKYSMQLSYTKDVDESLKALSKLRHDFKNHLLIIDGYARKNEFDKQKEYICKLNDEIGATKIYDTQSTLLSSILNTKNAVCEKQGIILSVNNQFHTINIDDFNLITILGNILDNAITAAAKTGKGRIDLSMIQLDSYLEITCKNNHCEKIKKRNGSLLTTKKVDTDNHGLGLGNVIDSVERLHGHLNLEYDEKYFSIRIVLPNYSAKAEKKEAEN